MGKLIMYFALSYFFLSRFLSRIAKRGFQKRPRQMLIGYLLLMAALYAWGAAHLEVLQPWALQPWEGLC
jgi:hypothetical protein